MIDETGVNLATVTVRRSLILLKEVECKRGTLLAGYLGILSLSTRLELKLFVSNFWSV
jgi:hypothetical protein